MTNESVDISRTAITEGDTRILTSGQIAERTRLTGWNEDIAKVPGVLQLLFGEMVKRAVPITQHYLSDLYHDVHWIDKHVTGPITFYYLVREWGTNIGTDRDLVILNRDPVNVLYRVEVTCEEHGEWWATFTVETP